MYLWTQRTCDPAALSDTMNRLELEGWEIFQILPGARPIVVASRPADRAEVEAAPQAPASPAATPGLERFPSPAATPGLERFPSRVRLGPEEAWWQQALRLVQGGHKQRAIKLVREQTKMGLRDSRELVEQHITTPPPPSRAQLEDETLRLVRAGQKIRAIKLVREHTRMGLREAKAYVEAL